MIVDKINAYLSGQGKTIDEAILLEVGELAKWAFGRQFGERQDRSNDLRLSAIGRCPRQNAYKLLGFEENGKEIDARARMVFLMGDLTELAVVGLCKSVGINVTATGADQKDVEIDGVKGHPDGIVTMEGNTYLLEVKSMSSFSFKDFEEGKLDDGYRYQINAYMFALGLSKAIVIALNKDAGVLGEMIVSRDDVIVTDIKQRIKDIRSATKEDLPYRPYQPNEKGWLPWNCGYCNFAFTCWPDAQKILVSGRYKLAIQPTNKKGDTK